MKVGKTLKKLTDNNYIFSVITKISLLLMGILISSLQVHFLGQDLDGRLSYITSNTTILNTVFVFGIHQAYAFFRKREPEDFKGHYLGSVITLFSIYIIVAGIVMVALRPTFDVGVIVLTIPILFFIKVVRYITLIEQPKIKNKVEIITTAAKVVFLLIAFLFFKAQLVWIVILLLFEELTALAMYLVRLKIKPIFDKSTFSVLRKVMFFGFFPMLNLLLNTLNYKLDVLMLKHDSDDYARVSIYTKGVGLSERAWAIPDAIRDIMISKLANGKKSDEVCKIIRVSNTFTLAVQIALVALGYFVVSILYGPGYVNSYYIVCIAMFGSYGMIYTKMVSAYNVVEGKQKSSLIMMFTVVVINFLMNLILIPRFGIYGAAVASVISYNAGGILFSTYFKKQTKSRFRDMLFVNKSDLAILKSFKKD